MLSLRCNYNIVGLGVFVPFQAFGGVEPYLFSIQPDGAGGSIDANGLYTAPLNRTGVDTVIVTDDAGDTAEFKIGVGLAEHLVLDILQRYMDLEAGQAYLMNQKISPVKDDRLYIALSTLSPKVIGVKKYYSPDGSEIISSAMSCPVDLTIYSRTTEALIRKDQVIHALSSDYSKRSQELNGFSIGKLPSALVTLNNVEGSSIPYAFNLTFILQYVSTSRSSFEYYDTFGFDYNILGGK